MDRVSIATVGSRIEAEMIRVLLATEGMEAHLSEARGGRPGWRRLFDALNFSSDDFEPHHVLVEEDKAAETRAIFDASVLEEPGDRYA